MCVTCASAGRRQPRRTGETALERAIMSPCPAYVSPVRERVKRLRKTLAASGVEEVNSKVGLAELFTTHELSAAGKSGSLGSLVVGLGGDPLTIQKTFSALTHAYFEVGDEGTAPTLHLDMCDYTSTLDSGLGQRQLQADLHRYFSGKSSGERPMIFLDNVYSCVKEEALLLLNVFIDPWNGKRAFFKSSNGGHADLSNSLWVLSLNTGEGMSSDDVYDALVQQWTATVDDSRITGGAYVGRLNNVISLRQREGGSSFPPITPCAGKGHDYAEGADDAPGFSMPAIAFVLLAFLALCTKLLSSKPKKRMQNQNATQNQKPRTNASKTSKAVTTTTTTRRRAKTPLAKLSK